MRRKVPATMGCVVAAGLGLLGVSALAGSVTYDFNTPPPRDLHIVGNNFEWRTTNGVNNTGYLALFDAVNDQHASVLFPDFDKGLIVKGFILECDLRIGNPVGNNGRPADGFSISYARADDPVVADLAQDPPVDNLNRFAGGPESGTSTGLAISFDTWAGNVLPDGPDLEGIIIRVDNKTLLINGQRGIPMPTRNGACGDPTSIQTGPWDNSNPGAPHGLCWAHLKAELNEAGQLTVTWKGTVIADKIQTSFAPSAGRLVFAGGARGANENTHVDNFKLTTIRAYKFIVGDATADPTGWKLILSDSGDSKVDAASIKMKYDNQEIAPPAITIAPGGAAGLTTVSYQIAAGKTMEPGSSHTLEVTAQDTYGQSQTAIRAFTVPGRPADGTRPSNPRRLRVLAPG